MSVFTIRHRNAEKVAEELSHSLDSRHLLNLVLSREIDAYSDLFVKKTSGKTRAISKPHRHLNSAQRKLLQELEEVLKKNELSGTLSISAGAHAYQKGRSTITAASVHLNMAWGIKVDIQAFFDHVSEVHVARAFRNAGFSQGLAQEYAKICTRLPLSPIEDLPAKYSKLSRTLYSNQRIKEMRPIYSRDPGKVPTDPDLDGSQTLDDMVRPFLQKHSRKFLNPLHGKKRPHKTVVMNSDDNLLDNFVIPPKRPPRIFENGYWKGFINSGSAPEPSSSRKNRMNAIMRKNFVLSRLAFFTNLKSPDTMLYVTGDMKKFYWNDGSHYPTDEHEIRMKTRQGYLPQGSVTSGIISNLVLAKFDDRMLNFCRRFGYRYSRYSDDIVISSTNKYYSKQKALRTIARVQKELEVEGFSLNRQKTRIITPGSRKFMLGLLVNGEKVRIVREDRDRLEKAIWQLSRVKNLSDIEGADTKDLNYRHLLENKRSGTYHSPVTPSNLLSATIGWLSYIKIADIDLLHKIQNSLFENKWVFENAAIEGEIKNHVQNLLASESPNLNKTRLENDHFRWLTIGDVSND
jgi:hypothetical protein